MKHMRLAFVILAVVGLVHAAATAQPYPTKPVRIIVPFAAGGTVDALARVLAAKVQDSLGQSVVVENRAGVGGNAGADAVAKAAPDGYTILQNTNGHVISPAIYRSLPFDVQRDFIPVTQLVASNLLLVANPKFSAANVRELIALAKDKPGSLNYGMTGVGNPLHLTMEMLMNAGGFKLQAVPYRGDAPLNTALISGEVPLAIVPFATAKANVDAGLLRALAIAGGKRVASLPDVPTIAESGLPGFELSSWQGWFVPANTPHEIVAVIQREAAKALSDRTLRERLEATGNEIVASTPDAFAAKVKDDLAKFAAVMKDAKIPPLD